MPNHRFKRKFKPQFQKSREMPKKIYYTVREAAEIAGVTPQTMYLWVRNRKIQSHQFKYHDPHRIPASALFDPIEPVDYSNESGNILGPAANPNKPRKGNGR